MPWARGRKNPARARSTEACHRESPSSHASGSHVLSKDGTTRFMISLSILAGQGLFMVQRWADEPTPKDLPHFPPCRIRLLGQQTEELGHLARHHTTKYESMKTGDIRKTDATKQTLFSAFAVMFICGVLPFANLPMRSVGGAVLFTVFFWTFPDCLRSRRGSLTPAFCLTASLWLSAAVVGVMCYLGTAEL
jgi:hypothetical protein